MRAAQLTEFDQPLALIETEPPEISADEVLVRVNACGVCHTDVALRNGSLPSAQLPFIPGHEPMGVITKLGSNVTTVAEGDRVCVNPLVTCGECFYCRRGQDDLCERWREAADGFGTIGRDRDGGFEEYVAVPARNVIELPASISDSVGAILMDAAATSFNAVQHADFEFGDTVVVFGIGGVGFCALKYLDLIDYLDVIAVDINEAKLEFAQKLGADQTVNFQQADPIEIVRDATNGRGADIAFEFSGAPPAMEAAVDSIRPDGTAVITGCAEEPWSIDGVKCCFDAINITGTHGFTQEQLHQIIELVASGDVEFDDLITHTYPLEEINTVIDVLESPEETEDLVGRMVVEM